LTTECDHEPTDRQKANSGALAEARRRARYGHRDWVAWRGRDGVLRAEPKTAESVKRALLAVGTKGSWYLIDRSTGTLNLMDWPIGLNVIKQARRGL